MSKKILISFLSIFLFQAAALAQATPLSKKAELICNKALTNTPFNYTDNFAPAFVAALPESYFLSLMKEVTDAAGTCDNFNTVQDNGQNGQFNFISLTTRFITLNLSVDEMGLINGLQVVGVNFPDIIIKTWGDIESELGKLSGETSLSITNFDKKTTKQIYGTSPKPLGSEFKLYILGALADKVSSGQLKWSDEHPINPRWKSLPSGIMHTWDDGKMVTLKEYAEYMIKVSDNTATDHLLHILGREVVEEQLLTMKNSHPTLNSPFLSTLEMFKLKWGASVDDISKFISGDFSVKNDVIKNILTPMPTAQIGTNDVPMSSPSYIHEIEWFGSTNSMCDGMEVLKNKQSPEALKALSLNTPFIDPTSDQWKYAGYKGGSEPGVLTMTYLLQAKSGSWGCISFATSNESKTINQWLMFDLIGKILNFSGTLL